jgi:hypothetical protein
MRFFNLSAADFASSGLENSTLQQLSLKCIRILSLI